MTNFPQTPAAKILALLIATMLTAVSGCHRDETPVPPSEVALKAGWDRKQIKVFAYACGDALFDHASRDYLAAARKDGVNDPKPFPEKEFRDSAFPMCLCISQRVAETWPLVDVQNSALQKAQGFIDDALHGGRCKPAGMLGDILRNRKDYKP
jgi:hypothetical protein